MSKRPERPVTIRQKNRHRKGQPELPKAGEEAQGAAEEPTPEPQAPAQARTPTPRPKARNLLQTEDLQALAEMDRDTFAAAMAGTVPLHQHEVGDRVTGTVVKRDGQVFLIGLGGKSEGILDRAEFLDEEGQPTLDVGDSVTLFVVSTQGGELMLSRQVRGEDAGAFLEQAREEGLPVDGKVSEKNSGGFVVLLAGRRAFCPQSQMTLPGRLIDEETIIGKTLSFVIQEIKGQDVVISRRPILEVEAADAARKLWASLQPGTDLDGTVTSVRDYGAFVDIGGLEGLVHISEMAWGHTKDPRDVVTEGQSVKVRVLKVEPTAGRLSLSLKSGSKPTGDPEDSPPAEDKKFGTLGDLFGGLKLDS